MTALAAGTPLRQDGDCFGDSVTFAHADTPCVELFVRMHHPEMDITLISAGIGGNDHHGLLGLAVLLSGCGTGVPAPAATADRGVTRPAVGGAPAPVAVREAPQRVLARVRIAAVGDVMAYRAVKESAAAADQREGERSLHFGGYGALFAAPSGSS